MPTHWPARRPSSLTVRKNFFVDLKLPSSLTQGDKPRFIARVHHTDLVGKLTLRLNIYAGGRDEVFPKTIDLKQDGVDEVMFEPFEIPETDSVRLTLTGTVGAVATSWSPRCRSVPGACRWWPVESGTGTDSNTVFVGLPAGRTYDNPEMLIVLSPTLERMLIELALGDEAYPSHRCAELECKPANLAAVRHHRRSGRGSVGGDRGACNISARPARPPHPRPSD